MELNADISLKELLVFLRDDFSISVHSANNKALPPLKTQIFKSFNVKKTNRKHFKSLNIDEFSTISEIKFLLEFHAGLYVDFRNDNGIKLSSGISLREAKGLAMSPRGDSKVLETALESAVSLAKKQALNADLDWVYRILKNTAYELKTSEDKLLMVKALVEICESSPDISVNVLSDIVKIFCVTDIDRLAVVRDMSYSTSAKVGQLVTTIESDGL
jgi:hypothetical protein